MLGAAVSATRASASIRALVLWAILFGLANLVTSVAGAVVLALLLLAVVGITNIMFNTLARTLLLLAAGPAVQGRVMALHGMLAHGSLPVGSLALGAVCELVGPRAGLAVAGSTAVVTGALLLAWLRSQRRRGALPAGVASPQPMDATPSGAASTT